MAGGKPNVVKLYEKIFTVKEMLAEAVNTCMEVANDAEAFGGEVARVITGQLRQGLIPGVQKFIDDKANPSSAAALIQFLDSVPLAWIRMGPEQDPNAAIPLSSTVDQQYAASTAAMPSAIPNVPNDATTAEAIRTMSTAGGQSPTMAPRQESAILNSRGNAIREEVLSRWQEEHAKDDVEGKLDFASLRESILSDGPPTAGLTPEMLVGALQKEDRIFDKVVESASTPRKRDVSTLDRLTEKDRLMGPIPLDEGDSSDFEDWRKMVHNDAGLEEALAVARRGETIIEG